MTNFNFPNQSHSFIKLITANKPSTRKGNRWNQFVYARGGHFVVKPKQAKLFRRPDDYRDEIWTKQGRIIVFEVMGWKPGYWDVYHKDQ